MSMRKTIEDLPDNWTDIITKLMGSGKPMESFLSEFKISRYYHGKFMKEYPEYKETVEMGKVLREKFWQEQVLLAATNKEGFKGNDKILIFAAKNILGWRSEPFQKEKEDVLKDKTGDAEIMHKFLKEADNEKGSGAGAVN